MFDTNVMHQQLIYILIPRFSSRFYQNADSSSSRKLFKFTLLHLPLVMTLMFVSKKSTKKKKKEGESNSS